MKSKKIVLITIGLAIVATIASALISNRHLVSVTTEQLASLPDRPVVYELGSNSCSSCVAMLEVMKKLESSHSARINVVKIDVFKDETAQTKFDLRVIPTQVIKNKDGVEVFRHEGFISYEALVAKLDQLSLLSDKKDLD